MALVSFDPFDALMRLQGELDRFFGKPLLDPGLSGSSVYPAVNIFHDKEGLVVRAEIPGFKPADLDIQIEARRLVIRGERKAPQPAENGSYHRRERPYGKFARAIQLPVDLDVSKAGAEWRNGVLTVRIPKAAAAQPRRIQVHAA
jgi:HSP20 family protein